MSSFFEKLKKGMGVEIPQKDLEPETAKDTLEQSLPEDQMPKTLNAKTKAVPQKRKFKKTEIEIEKVTSEPQEQKKNNDLKKPSVTKFTADKEKKWFEPEGQLAVDVYQTEQEIVIQSTIAGVKPADLDISIEADTVVIRGSREKPPEEEEINYFYQECYWGPFSRQIIIPEETDPSRAQATMKDGVLTIRIPKIERKKKRKIEVKE